MRNPNPTCEQNSCKFFNDGPPTTTTIPWIPTWDKNGQEIQDNPNTTTGGIGCLTCGRLWNFEETNRVAKYTEVIEVIEEDQD